MYKVECVLYAICSDGSIGKVNQGTKKFYTDENLENIEKRINFFLKVQNKIGVIKKIEKTDGTILKV